MIRVIELLGVAAVALVTAAAAVLHPLLGGLVGAACAVAVRLYDRRRVRETQRTLATLSRDNAALMSDKADADFKRIGGRTWG